MKLPSARARPRIISLLYSAPISTVQLAASQTFTTLAAYLVCIMRDNPGGWNDAKLKVYGALLLLGLAAYAVGVAMGWIDPAPPPR